MIESFELMGVMMLWYAVGCTVLAYLDIRKIEGVWYDLCGRGNVVVITVSTILGWPYFAWRYRK